MLLFLLYIFLISVILFSVTLKAIWPFSKFIPPCVQSPKETSLTSSLITSLISLNPVRLKNLGAVGLPVAIENFSILSNGLNITVIKPSE